MIQVLDKVEALVQINVGSTFAIKLQTVSVCPVCCLEIPAQVGFDGDMVVMRKECPAHGKVESFLERDTSFYTILRAGTAGIYPGHLIDVTTRCQLKCAYCYFPVKNGTTDPTQAEIINEAACVNRHLYLAGAEPTIRDDLPELMEKLLPYGGAGIVSNGIRFLDKDYLAACLRVAGRANDPYQRGPAYARSTISYHNGLNVKPFHGVMENLRSLNDRIAGPIFVMQNLAQLPDMIATGLQYRDRIAGMRIHAETALWKANHQEEIFLSDMLKALIDLARREHKTLTVDLQQGRTMWLPVIYDGLPVYLIRWNTKFDIDLLNTRLEPTYRAHNGEIVHLIYGYMINEAMERGWLKGRRIRPETK